LVVGYKHAGVSLPVCCSFCSSAWTVCNEAIIAHVLPGRLGKSCWLYKHWFIVVMQWGNNQCCQLHGDIFIVHHSDTEALLFRLGKLRVELPANCCFHRL